MKQLHAHWEALPTSGDWRHAGNLGVGRTLLEDGAYEERTIVTWTGTPVDVQHIVEANEQMTFLLALSTELARISSPQEMVCAAMARLRERLDAARVTLAEVDEQRNEAVLLRESGGAESRIEVASVPLEPDSELPLPNFRMLPHPQKREGLGR